MAIMSGSDVGFNVCIVWLKSMLSVESGEQESCVEVST